MLDDSVSTTEFVEVVQGGAGTVVRFYTGDGEYFITPPMTYDTAHAVADAVENALSTWHGWK